MLLLTIPMDVVKVDCVGDIHLRVPVILYAVPLMSAVQTSFLVHKV